MITREQVAASVLGAIRGLGKDIDLEPLATADEETRLYGAKSGVDSVTLVTLIAEVEDRLADDFGKSIVLADERAMSQTGSPFRRVSTLIDYSLSLLQGVS